MAAKRFAIVRAGTATAVLRAVFDLPVLKAKAEGDDGPVTSVIQIAVTGKFDQPGGAGKFAITRLMLRKIVDNFNEGKWPIPPDEAMVDFEHMSSDPPSATDGRAAGWVKALELRENGDELWATVEWTDEGAELQRSKAFKRFSPEIAFNKQLPDGTVIGPALNAVALTNRPFLAGMSENMLAAREALAGDVMLSEGLSFEQTRSFIEQALRETIPTEMSSPSCMWFGGPIAPGAYCYVWLRDTYDSTVVYSVDVSGRGCAIFERDYSFNVDGSCTLGAEVRQVVITYTEVTEAIAGEMAAGVAVDVSTMRGADMAGTAKVIKLKAVGGADVEIAVESLEALPLIVTLREEIATLSARPTEESVAQLRSAVTDLTERANKADAAAAQLRESIEVEAAGKAVDKLIASAKIPKEKRDRYIGLFRSDRETFDTIAGDLRARVPGVNTSTGETAEAGSGGDGPSGGAGVIEEVRSQVASLRAKTPALTVEQAQTQVFESNPDLYARYSGMSSRAASSDAGDDDEK